MRDPQQRNDDRMPPGLFHHTCRASIDDDAKVGITGPVIMLRVYCNMTRIGDDEFAFGCGENSDKPRQW